MEAQWPPTPETFAVPRFPPLPIPGPVQTYEQRTEGERPATPQLKPLDTATSEEPEDFLLPEAMLPDAADESTRNTASESTTPSPLPLPGAVKPSAEVSDVLLRAFEHCQEGSQSHSEEHAQAEHSDILDLPSGPDGGSPGSASSSSTDRDRDRSSSDSLRGGSAEESAPPNCECVVWAALPVYIDMAEVKVVNLAGRMGVWHVPKRLTAVGFVKECIHHRFGTPWDCAHLLCAGKELGDAELVAGNMLLLLAETIQITVSVLRASGARRLLRVKLDSHTSTARLRAIIEDATGALWQDQTVRFGGCVLRAGESLSSQGVRSGSHIIVEEACRCRVRVIRKTTTGSFFTIDKEDLVAEMPCLEGDSLYDVMSRHLHGHGLNVDILDSFDVFALQRVGIGGAPGMLMKKIELSASAPRNRNVALIPRNQDELLRVQQYLAADLMGACTCGEGRKVF